MYCKYNGSSHTLSIVGYTRPLSSFLFRRASALGCNWSWPQCFSWEHYAMEPRRYCLVWYTHIVADWSRGGSNFSSTDIGWPKQDHTVSKFKLSVHITPLFLIHHNAELLPATRYNQQQVVFRCNTWACVRCSSWTIGLSIAPLHFWPWKVKDAKIMKMLKLVHGPISAATGLV